MIFNSEIEAIEFNDRNININPQDKIVQDHIDKYDFYNANKLYSLFHDDMGKFFLYEKVIYYNGECKIYYPKLGIYLNEIPCDQTTEVEWVDYRRTSEWRNKFKFRNSYDNIERSQYIAEVPTKIQSLPLWHDKLLIYGTWSSKPTWQQLKIAYRRTWWYHRNVNDIRNIQINSLLK